MDERDLKLIRRAVGVSGQSVNTARRVLARGWKTGEFRALLFLGLNTQISTFSVRAILAISGDMVRDIREDQGGGACRCMWTREMCLDSGLTFPFTLSM